MSHPGCGLVWCCLMAAATVLTPARAASAADEETYARQRARMVAEQIARRPFAPAVESPRVLEAMRRVPRHEFVPPALRAFAYSDQPLPIGEGQTISQPYIVGLMSELASIQDGERVLEVGTGSGYQAAVLSELGAEVYSIEILEPLAAAASETLQRLGYAVQVRAGDGYAGWPEAAPFDAIVVTAAAPRVPEPLLEQLAQGGRLVIPLGDGQQMLHILERDGERVIERDVIPVRFVPMTGAVRGESPAED